MRCLLRALGFAMLTVGALQTPAWAQDGTTPTVVDPHGPAEIGMDVVAATELGTVGRIRGSLPVDDRTAVDLFVSLPERSGRSSFGFYGVQGRRRILADRTRRTEVFVTYGAAGIYSSYRDRIDWSFPILPIVGTGVQHQIAPHLVVRADVQATIIWPYGFHPEVGASVGFSVPFGGRPSRK